MSSLKPHAGSSNSRPARLHQELGCVCDLSLLQQHLNSSLDTKEGGPAREAMVRVGCPAHGTNLPKSAYQIPVSPKRLSYSLNLIAGGRTRRLPRSVIQLLRIFFLGRLRRFVRPESIDGGRKRHLSRIIIHLPLSIIYLLREYRSCIRPEGIAVILRRRNSFVRSRLLAFCFGSTVLEPILHLALVLKAF